MPEDSKPTTDAERLAKAMRKVDVPLDPDGWHFFLEAAKCLIDSGVVTVNPPPDPADQIAAAWFTEASAKSPSMTEQVRYLIAEGYITPGPRCDGVERAEMSTLRQIAAWDSHTHGTERDATCPTCLAVRVLRGEQ